MKKTTSNTREKQSKDTTDSIGEGRECGDRRRSLLGMPVTRMVPYCLQKCLLSVPCANMGVDVSPYVLGWHLWVYTPGVVCIPLPSAHRTHQSTSVQVLSTNVKVTQELSTKRQENGWVRVAHMCTGVLIKEQEKWMNYGSKTVDLRKIWFRILYKGWNHFYNETVFVSSVDYNLITLVLNRKRTKAGKALSLGEASEPTRGVLTVTGQGWPYSGAWLIRGQGWLYCALKLNFTNNLFFKEKVSFF